MGSSGKALEEKLKRFWINGKTLKKMTMDTDDLTEMAYQTILFASRISDYLKADIGVRSHDYTNEDDYLNGVLKFIREIKNDPEIIWITGEFLMGST